MKYKYHINNGSLKDLILELNNVKEEEIDVSSFVVDYDDEVLKSFKDKLDEYSGKRFLIVGDYDCDGITSTVITKMLLDKLNIKSNYYINSRSKEGYGLHMNTVKMAAEYGFEGLLLVDNGVKALDEINYAKQIGLKVLVIDHHEYEELPPIDGLLHPKLLKNDYQLLSAGALCTYLYNSYEENDYVTVLGGVSILSDVMPVLRYNRYLLKRMLDILNEGNIYQLNYLSGINYYTYDDVSFKLIPKINAVSRMDKNVNLLAKYLMDVESLCRKNAIIFDEINANRKMITESMLIEANKVKENHGVFVIAKSKLFIEGLCGVLASKLSAENGKPAIVFSEINDEYRASGRSFENFNIYEFLNNKKELFSAFGGHNQAVGLTISKDNYQLLIDHLDSCQEELNETNNDVIVIKQDDLNEITMNIIESLEPYGNSFNKPLLGIDNPAITKTFIIKGKYPKFTLSDNCTAISFNSNHIDKSFNEIIGYLSRDSYRPNCLSLLIEDLIEK